jgi:predicted phosphoribosyltransferase
MEAGRRLARLLDEYRDRPEVLVLGLPRGGVPVAYEVARALHAPLDVYLVRKLGVPGQEELAMGAIASGGVKVINQQLVREAGLRREQIDQVAASEVAELHRREQAYRHDRPAPALEGRVCILVDDGLATGSTMHAAVLSVRAQAPQAVVVAVPVGPAETCASLQAVADRVVCMANPVPFMAVGSWYEDFRPPSDAEVRELLNTLRER